MFRKLKDKLAEEMKSSPQRLQQFAQAAQAVVNSASSSISDISNNDLFSIADDGADAPQKPPSLSSNVVSNAGFQDVSLSHSPSPLHAKQENSDKLAPLNTNHFTNVVPRSDMGDSPTQTNFGIYPPISGANRTRRLSNSSNASDVSFRLPSYESPGGMFHLQSDLDISASEMEDNVNVPAQLERVSKEHLYAAYRKTNEKYNKYRGRYTDLARHYRNLERENAKAKAVLVETQDKALRRISELREQCQLEQSAKAHLENALRLELDERNLKIESLNTKIKLLQSYSQNETDLSSKEKNQSDSLINDIKEEKTDHQPLIDLSTAQDGEDITTQNAILENKHSAEIQSLNNKISKLEQLLVKCKETIKTHKEKNTQLNSELQIVSSQLEKMNQENEKLHNNVMEMNSISKQLDESKKQISKLQEELAEFDAKKVNEMSNIKSDLHLAKKEISSLNITIDLLKKREEENVISLAENKLSIHKELESKENEIKSLNESIAKLNLDFKTKDSTIANLKKTLQDFEDDKKVANDKLNELSALKIETSELMTKLNEVRQQNQELDSKYVALLENLKCTELQLKQETDEKLALIDRNNFLELRNKQISEENVLQIKRFADLEKESHSLSENVKDVDILKKNCKDASEKYDSIKIDYEKLTTIKNELEEKLNVANENIEKLSNDIKCVENEKNEIDLKYNKITEELNTLRVEHENLSCIKNSIDNKLKDSKNTQNKIDEYIEKITLLENQLETTSIKCDKYEAELVKIQDEIKVNSEVSNDYENKLSNYNVLQSNFDTLNNKYEESLKYCKGVVEELETLKINYENSISEKRELIEKIGELTIDYNKLNEECEKNNLTIIDMKKQISDMESDRDAKKTNSNKLMEEVHNIQRDMDDLLMSHKYIMEEKNIIEDNIRRVEQFNSNLDKKNVETINSLKAQIEKLEADIKSLKSEKDALLKENMNYVESLAKLEQSANDNETKIKEFSNSNNVWELKLSNILDDNNALQEKCNKMKQEKEVLLEQVSNLEQKINEFEMIKTQFEEAKLEKEFLNMRVTQLDSDLKQTSNDKNKFMLDIDSLKSELLKAMNDNKELLNNSQKEIDILKEAEIKLENNLKCYIVEKNNFESKLNAEINEKEKLMLQLQNVNDKSVQYQKLLEEKMSIEMKLNESYAKSEIVEKEKNDEIVKLKSEYENNNCLLTSKIDELNDFTKKYSDLKTEFDHLNVQIKVLQQIESENITNTEKMHLLQEENNRLSSSIEGLQNHLTKITLDNSQLNDKIREMLANGEVMQVTDVMHLESSPNNKDANVQTQLNQLKESNMQLKEELKGMEGLHGKVMELERQNSILIEEKLELEDQIKTSMDKHLEIKENNDSDLRIELNKLHARFESVVSEKMEMDSRLANLELINRSNDNNLKILEQKNQKLCLTNEKLERRLDETLVSLNHIRNLEENTELEYLRNILYEYLTGPTNNNMVLAKVLAAVVKFDHRQTQLVLEREKERQGLLGQLGLL